MSEQFDAKTGQRVQALYSYIIALEQGDLDMLTAVLYEAEHDAILEHMLLELHHASLETTQSIHVQDALPLLVIRHTYFPTQDAEEKDTQNGTPLLRHLPPSFPNQVPPVEIRQHEMSPSEDTFPTEHPPSSTRRRHPRLSAFFQGLAAVLIVAALLGSFIALFAHHHSPGTGSLKQGYKGSLVTVASSDGIIYALQPSTGVVLWHYAARQPVVAMIQQDGAVYVSTQGTLRQPAYSDPAFLSKLRASDGALLWKKGSSGVGISVAVDDGIIVTSEGRPGGLIKALNAKDGTVLWQHSTEPGVGNGWGDAMITEQDHVLYLRYLAHGSEGLTPQALVSIKAFDIRSGNLLWISTAFPHITIKTAVLTSKAMYAIAYDTNTDDEVVITIDRKNGKMMKMMNLPPGERMIQDGFDAGTLFVNKLVLKGSIVVLNAYICAIRITDGTSLWCLPIFPNNVSNVTNSNRIFYYKLDGTTNTIEQVIARNTNDGRFRWRWTIPGNYSSSNSEHIVAYDGIVYVTTLHGIFALRGTNGHVLWHVLANTNLESSAPSVSGYTYQIPPS